MPKIASFALISSLALFAFSCNGSGGSKDRQANTSSTFGCLAGLANNSDWSGETEVEIDGYSANAMEPKITADQGVLFFNDKPATDSQMNIHYAVKQWNGRYLYIGTVPGTVDTSSLDGVPAVDRNGVFYFTSLRNYTSSYQSLYRGQVAVLGVNSLQINGVTAADNSASSKVNGTIDMDMDVSWDGLWAVVSRAQFAGNPFPEVSRLHLFQIASSQLSTYSQSEVILAELNKLTNGSCRLYAPNLSSDLKELYFTVLEPKDSSNSSFNFSIVVSKRNSSTEAFSTPQVISAISGVVEGPSISDNDSGKTLFYHKFDTQSGRFKIYKVSRP